MSYILKQSFIGFRWGLNLGPFDFELPALPSGLCALVFIFPYCFFLIFLVTFINLHHFFLLSQVFEKFVCLSLTHTHYPFFYFNFLWLSRGEICGANFIPPCEWCESRQLFLQKWLFGAKTGKMGPIKTALAPKPHNCGRNLLQTDRQTNSLIPYTGVCGFLLQVKFATSLLASLAGDNQVITKNLVLLVN